MERVEGDMNTEAIFDPIREKNWESSKNAG